MALDQEKVVNIVMSMMNTYGAGSWDRDHFVDKVSKKAIDRRTSPEGFADWLILQHTFKLMSGVSLWQFRTDLSNELRGADSTIVPESVKIQLHRILIVDSRTDYIPKLKENMTHRAGNYGIPSAMVSFDHQQYLTENPNALRGLLEVYTGAVLHNSAPTDLQTIRDFLREKQNTLPRIVIVKTNGSTTPEHEALFAELEDLGAMVIMKPFPSLDELARAIFGIG